VTQHIVTTTTYYYRANTPSYCPLRGNNLGLAIATFTTRREGKG